MPQLNALCVYCGSTSGSSPSFAEAAVAVGSSLAERHIDLVYGGASVGLMGVVADAALAAGGRVHGVITELLVDHEIAHPGLTELEVVRTMHERKARMAELADGFIMLPGGFGTLEEFMEVVTWLHLAILDKPCGILNTHGYFDSLLTFMKEGVEQGFIRSSLASRIVVSDDPEQLLDLLVQGSSPGISG
jgi:uncharacterized protein (TIGR00730 family)